MLFSSLADDRFKWSTFCSARIFVAMIILCQDEGISTFAKVSRKVLDNTWTTFVVLYGKPNTKLPWKLKVNIFTKLYLKKSLKRVISYINPKNHDIQDYKMNKYTPFSSRECSRSLSILEIGFIRVTNYECRKYRR